MLSLEEEESPVKVPRTMEILLFPPDRRPERAEGLDRLPGQGFAWLDFVGEDDPDWQRHVRRLAGCEVHEEHVRDSLNAAHPSIYECTDDYEMLVFRGLASGGPDSLESRPTAFFVFPRVLVTVRSRESLSVRTTSMRLLGRAPRSPREPIEVMLMVLGAMVDRFMALREPLARQVEEWQEALLDPSNPFDDWMSLMRHRKRLWRLERMCDEQVSAVDAWREERSAALGGSLTVRINDLLEHIQRVRAHAQHLEAQTESLVQIHFAAVAHRTNGIVRTLTVLAAVFLPLTLVAGIFGMNFEHMPELRLRYGYYGALGLMLFVGFGLFLLFRRRRWL
jgi:magnesium/cobalt transport protein CorA